VGTKAPFPFAIHDTVLAGGSPNNCVITTAASSESNNLEDDGAGQCGLGAANHDLIGADPQLASSLADNGGPTQTLAPATTSPILGAGGQCLDPTATPPNQPLTVDQRGQPRPNPCDIGAFQAQLPTNTLRPVITGTVARGQTLICSQGSWTGDGPFDFAYRWLRNGAVIAGTTTNTYVIGALDAGQTLACQVTAIHYGSRSATSSFVTVTPYPVITVLKVSVSASALIISLGCRGSGGQRCIGLLRLTVVEKLRGGRVIAVAAASVSTRTRTITVGRRAYSILARHTASIRVPLKPGGTRLLAQFSRLPVMLTVAQSTALGTGNVASRFLTIRPAHQTRRRR
jgi:hypothetical protein